MKIPEHMQALILSEHHRYFKNRHKIGVQRRKDFKERDMVKGRKRKETLDVEVQVHNQD